MCSLLDGKNIGHSALSHSVFSSSWWQHLVDFHCFPYLIITHTMSLAQVIVPILIWYVMSPSITHDVMMLSRRWQGKRAYFGCFHFPLQLYMDYIHHNKSRMTSKWRDRASSRAIFSVFNVHVFQEPTIVYIGKGIRRSNKNQIKRERENRE